MEDEYIAHLHLKKKLQNKPRKLEPDCSATGRQTASGLAMNNLHWCMSLEATTKDDKKKKRDEQRCRHPAMPGEENETNVILKKKDIQGRPAVPGDNLRCKEKDVKKQEIPNTQR